LTQEKKGRLVLEPVKSVDGRSNGGAGDWQEILGMFGLSSRWCGFLRSYRDEDCTAPRL